MSVLSVLSCLVLAPGMVFGSPASALREYKAGQYDQALKEYEQLLQRKGDDPRLHFNAGAAAYRNRQFDEAAKQFNATLASPDLNLLGRAYYNEGNSLFHLGERAPDPSQRTEAWQKALQDYQSTLKLNPKDADAQYNYQFVKQKLEELKQQQQQQSQQNKQDQKQNQDQQQKQQQNEQQKDQNQQQQQQQQQQAQKEQKQDSAQQQKKQEEQQQAANQSPEQKKQEQQQAQQSQTQPAGKQDQMGETNAAAYAAGEMTPEQARQLLDAQKGDEKMLQLKPEQKPVDRTRPFKDW